MADLHTISELAKASKVVRERNFDKALYPQFARQFIHQFMHQLIQ